MWRCRAGGEAGHRPVAIDLFQTSKVAPQNIPISFGPLWLRESQQNDFQLITQRWNAAGRKCLDTIKTLQNLKLNVKKISREVLCMWQTEFFFVWTTKVKWKETLVFFVFLNNDFVFLSLYEKKKALRTFVTIISCEQEGGGGGQNLIKNIPQCIKGNVKYFIR